MADDEGVDLGLPEESALMPVHLMWGGEDVGVLCGDGDGEQAQKEKEYLVHGTKILLFLLRPHCKCGRMGWVTTERVLRRNG